MKKYSEEQGETVFDWNAFLNKEFYTREELDHAYKLSCQWSTCAVGQQSNLLVRSTTDFQSGVPDDIELLNNGVIFGGVIRFMQFSFMTGNGAFSQYRELAKHTLEKIEQRSAELLEELTK